MLFGLGDKLSFLTHSFGRIFAWTPGDIYDASLNNWFLENNLQYFLNGGNIFDIREIFNSSLYWPEKNTLAFSDNWILITPVYAFLRFIFSPNFSFTGIIVLSLTTNVMACYRLCRHASNIKLYRLIAACLSGFSLTVLARLGHAQLMPAFAGILAMDSFIAAFNIDKCVKNSNINSKNLKHDSQITILFNKVFEGIIWLLFQIGIGFYQGAFFTIASFSLLFILVLNIFILKITKVKFIHMNLFKYYSKFIFSIKILAFSFIFAFNCLVYNQYFIYSRTQGGRSWGEVSTQIPKFWSLWFNTLSNAQTVSFPSPVQSVSYNGPFWEHSMFPGYTFIFILLLGIWFCIKGSIRNDQNPNIKWRVVLLSQTSLLMLLISMGIGGTNPVLTFWIIIWKLVPGVSAIRAVSRIGIPIVFILSPLIAWTLTELNYRFDKKTLTIIFSFLFMFYLAGNVTKGINRFDSTEYAAKKNIAINKIDEILQKNNCKAFYMTSPDTNNWMYDRVHPQMMAMWASIKSGIPTSSGYSGNNPDEGWNHMMSRNQLDEWLKKKGVNEDSLKEVCYIDGNQIFN